MPHHSRSEAAAPADALVGVARSRQFFPELESLRGLAVLLVVAFHTDASIVFLPHERPASVLTSFVRGGDTGVDLFFVLSGFLLSLPFITAARGGRPVSLRLYFSRRALRILPLYYAAVLAGVLANARRLEDLPNALPYLVFLNGFTGTSAGLPPFSNVWWSLATEAQFYLLLPLLPLALSTRRGRLVGGLALLAYAIVFAATVEGRLHMDTFPRQFVYLLSVVGRGPLFLCGIAAAWLVARFGDQVRGYLAASAWWRGGGADLTLAAIAVAMAFFLRGLVAESSTRPSMTSPFLAWHAASGVFWTAILLCLVLAPLRSKAFLCNSALARLGVLSYSIYLLHIPILQTGLRIGRHYANGLWGWNLRVAPLLAALAVICYAASTLTYTWIERPFLVRKARFE